MSLDSILFYTGVALLVTNPVVGWAGVAVCAALGRRSKKKGYYALGTAIYAFSWVMLAGGVILAGEEGVKRSKDFIRTHWWASIWILLLIVWGLYWNAKRKKLQNPAK